MNLVRNTLAVAVLALASSAAFAGPSPQSDTFVVSITLENDCAIAIDDVDHGTATDLTTISDDAPGTGTITCTFADSYLIAFSADNNGGSVTNRLLKNSANTDTLTFNLYRDAAHTEVLGDGAGTTFRLTGNSTGGGTADNLQFYSSVDAGQTAKSEGDYAATITATATF